MYGKKRRWWFIVRTALAAIFMISAVSAFCGFGGAAAGMFRIQFGPALMNCFASFGAGALTAVAVIAVGTFLFGRVYCSVLCPFGILQDAVIFISRRRGRNIPDMRKTRYAIAGIVCGMLLCGWTGGFLLLDPYSNFGRIFASFTVGGAILPAAAIILAVWKKRIFCTAICPVGTLLGLISKHGVFRLAVAENCLKCGKCVRLCPTGCVDPAAGVIDNERCVRCMKCVSECPAGSIGFARPEKIDVPVDESRRAFLVTGGVLLAGLAAGAAAAKFGLGGLERLARRFKILPPGAGDIGRFAAKCTACQLCVVNCPAEIIVPAPGGDGPVSLDLNRGACRYDCRRCSQLCPTGALRKLTLEEKQRTKIAEAVFNPLNCLVFQEELPCGRCAEACPAHAITLRADGTPMPVDTARCIGCGACQAACPAPEKAMTVREIAKQLRLEG